MPDNINGVDVLPDCRARAGRGAKPVKGIPGVAWEEPVYCANCGRPAGYATQVESLSWVFVLCDDCGRFQSMIAATGVPSTQEYRWRQIKQEQLDVYGRELTPEELRTVLDSGMSPLATLLKQKGL